MWLFVVIIFFKALIHKVFHECFHQFELMGIPTMPFPESPSMAGRATSNTTTYNLRLRQMWACCCHSFSHVILGVEFKLTKSSFSPLRSGYYTCSTSFSGLTEFHCRYSWYGIMRSTDFTMFGITEGLRSILSWEWIKRKNDILWEFKKSSYANL